MRIVLSDDLLNRPNESSTPFIFRIMWTVFSALLSALSQPNELFLYGNWLLGLFCLVPLYLALVHTRKLKEAGILGAIFGAFHHALTSYWLFFYKDFAFWTLGTTTIAYAVVYSAAIVYGWFMLSHAGNVRPIVFAFSWAAFEFAKSTGFLGYPWGLLPYSFTAVPLLLQTADIWGVYGISAFLALVSASFAEYFLRISSIHKKSQFSHNREIHWISLCFVIGFAFLTYGYDRLSYPFPVSKKVRILLCQQNTDPWRSGELAALDSNINLANEALERNYREGGQKPDLIVFSEMSLQRPLKGFESWFEKNPPHAPLLPTLRQWDVPLLTGLPEIRDWDTYEASNSVGLIYPNGSMGKTYAKMHPVPFAEAIPFWEFTWFREFMKNVIGLESGWIMGNESVLFSIDLQNRGAICTDIHALPKIRFAAPICFEDAFAELCRNFILQGADVLINLTNDSWSRTTSAQIQHYAVARFRAIESRKTLVRSTNSGVTCVIGANGKSLIELPPFVAESAIIDIPLYSTKLTFYMQFGDWFAWWCAAFVCFMFAWSIWREKKIM